LINFGFVPLKALLDRTAGLTPEEARYLAPEHLVGRGLDQRSDIFSLGIILYELLTRQPIDVRLKRALPDVEVERAEVPARLAAVATRAVAFRPELRFRTVGEMETELSATLGGFGAVEAAAWVATRFGSLSTVGSG
jgi:serine/threonine protein kinase